jgi:hypothetical protein
MPHTNRKKKSSGSSNSLPRGPTVKRQEVADADGWTHIVGPGKPKITKAINRAEQSRNLASDFMIGDHGYVNRTLDDMKADHEKAKRKWIESKDYESMKAKLQSIEGKEQIESVVCLGLGSLQSCWQQSRYRSHGQLAALMTIVENLGMSQAVKI